MDTGERQIDRLHVQAASANAALIDGHESFRIRPIKKVDAASANAALIDGHVCHCADDHANCAAASANAALIDGHPICMLTCFLDPWPHRPTQP